MGTRVLRGMAWAYTSYVGGRILGLAFTAVLARVLAPSAFGVVAMAMALIALLETLSDFGLSQALIIADDEEASERAQTVFVYSVVIGAGLMLATVLLAPVAASFFNEPALTKILPVLGSVLFIRSLSATHYALAQKRLDFKLRTVTEVADLATRGVVGVGLAITGFGAWSLVLGYLAGALVMTVTLWALVPWRPVWRRSSPLGSLAGFGAQLTAVNLIAVLIANVDYIFVGRVLGTEWLGLYTLGFKLPELLIINFSVVAGRVLFAAFAAVARDSLTAGFLRSMRGTLMLCLPLTAGLIVFGRPLILLAFGEQWVESVSAMRLLTLYALAVAIGIPAGSVYKAIGRADILLRLAVPRAVLTVGSIALFVDHGILAVAICQVVVASVFTVIGIVQALRILSVRTRDLLDVVSAPLLATAGMTVVMAVIAAVVPGAIPSMVTAGLFGALAYIALLWFLARDTLQEMYVAASSRARPAQVPAAAVMAGQGTSS